MNTLEKEAIQYMKWKNISSLTATDYQNSACKTAIFPKELGVQYLALGLTGEAGEVANKVKKLIRDGGDSPDKRKEIAKAKDPEKKRKEIEDKLAKSQSPFPRAEAFSVHEIIDPKDTRQYLCSWISRVQKSLQVKLLENK